MEEQDGQDELADLEEQGAPKATELPALQMVHET